MIAAPQGFRRTLVLESSIPGRSSREPGLTNRLRNRGKSKIPAGPEAATPLGGAPNGNPT